MFVKCLLKRKIFLMTIWLYLVDFFVDSFFLSDINNFMFFFFCLSIFMTSVNVFKVVTCQSNFQYFSIFGVILLFTVVILAKIPLEITKQFDFSPPKYSACFLFEFRVTIKATVSWNYYSEFFFSQEAQMFLLTFYPHNLYFNNDLLWVHLRPW